MLEQFAKGNPTISRNLSESPAVRSQIRQQMLRDPSRADLQKTRQFMSEADWAKAVELMRQGMKPAAALAALGYSLSGMAAEQQGEP
jgi:DNA-binding MurR/RpiR family transcriptional regulator